MSAATRQLPRTDHQPFYENPYIDRKREIKIELQPTVETTIITEGFEEVKQISSSSSASLLALSSLPSFTALPHGVHRKQPATTKIPYPLQLTANCCNNKSETIPAAIFQRSASLRLRGKTSNLLPFIMEPNENETTTTPREDEQPQTAAKRERNTTHNNKTLKTNETDQQQERYSTTGNGQNLVSQRRKLKLISQPILATDQQQNLRRSLSLRRNYKVSEFQNNNKTDNPKDCTDSKKCAALNGLHDKGSISGSSTAANNATSSSSASSSFDESSQSTQQAAVDYKALRNAGDGENIMESPEKNIQKMSLNPTNGINNSNTTQTATQTPAAAAATTTTKHHHHHHLQQQPTRPSTLLTLSTSSSSSCHLVAGGNNIKPITPTGSRKLDKTIAKTPSAQQPRHPTLVQSKDAATSPETKYLTPKTPPVTPDSPATYLDDDLDSLYSYATTTSGRSTMSCEHPYVARNGTTFSGRKMKYVVHCSNYAGQIGADYLTPTQRAQRHIKRLKELLSSARQDLEQKDSEILRLTREVVELRLFKASLSSPEERSASSDAVTVREAELKTSQDVSPIVDMVDDVQKSTTAALMQQHPHHPHHHHPHHHHNNIMNLSSDMQSSFADSGHFEDSSVHSKDSSYSPHSPHSSLHHTHDGNGAGDDDAAATSSSIEQYEIQRQELIRMYEQRIEDLIRNQDAATSDMKRSTNDRIEALLQKLAECNTRYADIVPDYEHAKERIRELEKQLEDLQRKLAEHEEKQKQMYLHMYQKGQEAERIARADQALELAHRAPQNNKVSINELLQQLQSTQDELENIRAAECRKECGSNHALLTAKEAISLWVLGARKTIYRRLLEAQKNRTHVDPEVTLQFLKSAIYYFLTDKENSQGHLQAIESILEFSEAEKQTIEKARTSK